MKTLHESIQDAANKKVALGHFNISNIEGFWAVIHAAQKLNVPVIIGVSEGERDFIGIPQVVGLVQSAKKQFDMPIFLNADHTYSFDRVKEAIDAGFDSVIIDGAKLSFEENVKLTKQCVDYARKTNPDVLVEAELGYIGQSSKILDALPEGVTTSGAGLTTPEQAKQFVTETGIDLFAPAVGNVHGMMRVGHDPRLDIPLIAEIRTATGVPLVLHGGSGTVDEDFVSAIKAGINIVHISTELRVAFKNGIQKALQENPDEVAPYKIMREPIKAMEKVAIERLQLFNS
ncbi:MAG: Tagatose-bisphosphate aldolase, fructose-bisphosphate aldolase, class [Candidatus Paceibacter sp.]|jgi:fructose-bisphosphate aldolase class II|nr:Tagatose-bisphosphate aldolase, fructose-bisphosphate aldolase, class [Candidatus Paceibacter sp.]